MQNETLINKIQENFNEFKKSTEIELKDIKEVIDKQREGLDQSCADLKQIQSKMKQETLTQKVDAISKMQESQNFVLKDLHEKSQRIQQQMDDLEKVDLHAKLNAITRKMIFDVVRE